MKIINYYIPYETPRIGIFLIDTEIYKLPEGWLTEEKEFTIIGEERECYIKRIYESIHGEWINGKVVEFKFINHVGIHKSRFVRWLPNQLTLF